MAKTLVGALRVTLGLDSAEFAAGAARVQSLSARLSKQLMGIGAAVSAVGVGIAAGVRQQLNAADDMVKTASKIGVPVEELSKLAYAAKLSGLSMDTLQTGLARLSKNLVESEDKFAKLGIKVRDASGQLRPTSAIVADLADVMARMPDGAEKTALAMELFGRSGAEMIPLLNGGAESIKAMTDEAEAMGLVITEETGRAAEQFNDNLTRLSSTVTGLFRIIAAQLAPVLAQISDFLVGVASRFQNLSPEMQKFIGVMAGLVVVLGPVLVGLGLVVGALGAIGAPVLAAIAAVALLVAGFLAFGDQIGLTIPTMEELRDFWNDLGTIAEALKGKVEQMATDTWTAITAKFSEMSQAADNLAKAFKKMAEDAYNWVTKKFDELVAWLGNLPTEMINIGKNIIQGIIDGLNAKWLELKAKVAEINNSIKEKFTLDWWIKSPSKVTEGYGRNIAEGLAKGIAAGQEIVGQAVTSLNDTARGAMKGIGDLGNQIGNMFATAATNVLTGVQSLREAVAQLLQQLAQLLINSAMKQLFGNIFGGLNLGIGGYATGTFSAARGLAMVGEEGPELINFRGGERVYNARDTARLAAGGDRDRAQPVSMTSNVYLDGELILSRLETAEGEARINTVLRRLGYAG
jgi:hypothetical protein